LDNQFFGFLSSQGVVNMSVETIAALGAQWLWDQFGDALSEKAIGTVKVQWAKFHWKEAEIKYRERMHHLYGTVRILGYPNPINVDEIYTDVYVLDRPAALRRYDFTEVPDKFKEQELNEYKFKRIPLLRIAIKENRLYLLGKPGSGKTTFLKYLTLQACKGKIDKTPIFISLKEWADSGLDISSYINLQFEICQFPEPNEFVAHLLNKGNAFILFDGLDEVSQENNKRQKIIGSLKLFSKRYPDLQICITCRIAASEYFFEHFILLEIADFDDKQISQFARKWFHADKSKLDRFNIELEKPEHQGLFELASTPLLLALLCLAFDEIGYFPTRRVDLYRDALDALMRKWDASRGIQRDEVYKKLSIVRKEQLLSRIAAEYFERGIYYIKEDDLTREISNYMNQLPPIDNWEDQPDGLIVLKSVEAQHGILIERARGIYSFLHLTFQEYFTARYIVDNSVSGTLERLTNTHLVDNRWHEIFLMTSSLLSEADEFFQIFLGAINNIILEDEFLISLLDWIDKKVSASKLPNATTRGILLSTVVSHFTKNLKNQSAQHNYINYSTNKMATELATELSYDHTAVALGLIPFHFRNRIHLFDFKINNTYDLRLAHELGINLKDSDLQLIDIFTEDQFKRLTIYLKANLLLLECVQLAWVLDRPKIGNRILLPIKI
jgi:hypothetical protein